MQTLNLPPVVFKIKNKGSKQMVFDIIRKKYVVLTPEEWVRQHFVHYLIIQRNYAAGLIAVEAGVTINGLKQRADIVVYNRKGRPVLIVECKAADIKIDHQVFDQAARYNMKLGVDYLVVTNGLLHFCARVDKGAYELKKEVPSFDHLHE